MLGGPWPVSSQAQQSPHLRRLRSRYFPTTTRGMASRNPNASLPVCTVTYGSIPQRCKATSARRWPFWGPMPEAIRVPGLAGHVVDRIVQATIPLGTTWQRWASLGSNLQLLAEASPDSFITALGRGTCSRPMVNSRCCLRMKKTHSTASAITQGCCGQSSHWPGRPRILPRPASCCWH